MPKEILTTNEAADLLGIARTSLINWVNRGELTPFTTPGGHRRFKQAEVLRFAEKHNFEIQDAAVASIKKQRLQTRVLIVDDDDDFRVFAKVCLAIAGEFEVKESSDGIDAALITGSWKPNIILLDLKMPKMDGFQFCSQIRSNDDFKDIRIVIMTAYADNETKSKIAGLSIDGVLNKPVGIKDFVDAIRKL